MKKIDVHVEVELTDDHGIAPTRSVALTFRDNSNGRLLLAVDVDALSFTDLVMGKGADLSASVQDIA